MYQKSFVYSFKYLCKRYHIISWNVSCEKFSEESELTAAFCVLANKICTSCRFVPGTSEECNINYSLMVNKLSTQVLGQGTFDSYFIKNINGERASFCGNIKTKELDLLRDLRDSIDFRDEYQKRGCRHWQSNKLYN